MDNAINHLTFSPITLLIVDDHILLRKSLLDWMRMLFPDWYILVAVNGEEALEISGQESPDLVLMDINMPGMDGIETTRRLKSLYPEMLVVILSIHNNQVYRNAAAQAGADAYIAKSTMYETLINVLSALLSEMDE